MIQIIEVESREDVKDFINLPFLLYKDDPYWVPPLKREYKKYITGVSTSVNSVGGSQMFLAKKDGKVVGRVLAGFNQELNEYHGVRDAYFSQYEAIDDIEVARGLIDACKQWAKKKELSVLKGPLSIPGGEDNRGFLLDNFEDIPYIQNVYNFPYYNDQMVELGMEKYHDCYAFDSNPDPAIIERYRKVIPYAMRKYKFRVDKFRLDKQGLVEDYTDVSEVIKKGMPKNDDWIDLMPPSEEEIKEIVQGIVPFADEDFLYIARNEKNEPIAFNIAMPDYNLVIKEMKGKMSPLAMLKFLHYKKKINRLRVFVLFVIPEYRNQGVTQAIYLELLKNAINKGYDRVEGSTIWDYNLPMLNDIYKLGAKLSKTYRIYKVAI